MLLIRYSSNNSRGDWWLTDEDWKNLEKAGWKVEWGGHYFCNSEFLPPPKGAKKCRKKDCKGHRKFKSWKKMKDSDRWLGCLAKEASKDFPSFRDAILEFEKITGQNASDEGCNCCGPPHSFESGSGRNWDSYSGEGVLKALFGEVPSYREAVERLNK